MSAFSPESLAYAELEEVLEEHAELEPRDRVNTAANSIAINVWGCSELPSTRRLVMLVSGQVLALLQVTTGAISALLVRRGLAAPTFVALCTYVMLSVIFGSLALLRACKWHQGVLSLWISPEETMPMSHDRLLIPKFILFALADVEANHLIVRAYQYAPMTNITLLDAL